jgi:HD-like signal output (HDOD) protein/CheY-like chemotaxis protein
MHRVHFVDDDANCLRGIRNVLRPRRHEWDMAFSESGPAALEAMAQTPADVVISDLRMPGMDGVAFLQKVRAAHPDTVRMVLSGNADLHASLQAVSVAQQVLAKPCAPEDLARAIESALRLRSLLDDTRIRGAIGSLNELPSLPSVYNELNAALVSPGISLRRVGDIVCRDMGMSVKVLQLANSAFFGLGQKMSSPRHAVCYLGLDTVRHLVLSAEAFRIFQPRGRRQRGWFEQLERAALLRARIVSSILDSHSEVDDGFIAGMLADVGQLVLVSRLDGYFEEVVLRAQAERKAIHVVERETGAVSHARVGAYLLGIWGLLLPVVDAVAGHHDPSPETGPRNVVQAVAAAEELVDQLTANLRDGGASLSRRELIRLTRLSPRTTMNIPIETGPPIIG